MVVEITSLDSPRKIVEAQAAELVYGACKLYLRLSEMWLASCVLAGDKK